MSRIQFVDLDTSSDEEDAGSVLISKHEMQTRFRWCNPVGVSHIKQGIRDADVTKYITETQKSVHMQDQLYENEGIDYEQEESDGKSDDKETKETDSVQKVEQQKEIENTDLQIEGKEDQKEEYEQGKTEEKSDDTKNQETDSTQKSEQLQELENREQQVGGESDQKEEDHLRFLLFFKLTQVMKGP